jgi:hypothetical protein
VRLTYIVPVHNETQVLRAKVEVLVRGLRARGEGEALLVENGSSDASWDLCQELEREHRASAEDPVSLRAYRVPAAGIGHAYDHGLRAMFELHPASEDQERWAVLTAADLPFGFTDVEAAERYVHDARIMIGSKAHPDSKVDVDMDRRLASKAYRLARRTLLGSRVGDSQGSIIVRADLARALVPMVRARGFFYSTELVYFAEREGERVREVPVTLEKERSERKSTVKPVKDGLTMLGQLLELRTRRLRP